MFLKDDWLGYLCFPTAQETPDYLSTHRSTGHPGTRHTYVLVGKHGTRNKRKRYLMFLLSQAKVQLHFPLGKIMPLPMPHSS